MKRILTAGLLLLFVQLGMAQQEGQFTQFMYNQLSVNPAYAGSRGFPSLMALYRGQWLGFKGAPKNSQASFNAPLFGDRVGFGLTVANNDLGITNSWNITMAYSYNIPLSEKNSLRFGIQGNIRQLGIDFADPSAIIRETGDPSIQENMNTNQTTGNFGVGAYFTGEKFYAGVSVPHLYPTEFSFNGDPSLPLVAQESPHFYGIVGTLIPIKNNLDFKPSVLVKYVENAPVDLDVNLSFVFNKEVHIGASYRMGGDGAAESVDLTALYQVSNLGFGIAYDFTLSDISQFSNGSFEAMVRYDFIKERTDMANPRFFF
ncbi:MAG: type IX secretion system membrane protein PorP/SprF [Saprospiraceae bacterium]|nr:type IX secretion system membrane protein PorP/SprF [Saprospiraceae bacterium]